MSRPRNQVQIICRWKRSGTLTLPNDKQDPGDADGRRISEDETRGAAAFRAEEACSADRRADYTRKLGTERCSATEGGEGVVSHLFWTTLSSATSQSLQLEIWYNSLFTLDKDQKNGGSIPVAFFSRLVQESIDP